MDTLDLVVKGAGLYFEYDCNGGPYSPPGSILLRLDGIMTW